MDTHLCSGELDSFYVPDEVFLSVSWTAVAGSVLPTIPAIIPLKRQRITIPVGSRNFSLAWQRYRPVPLYGNSSEVFESADGLKYRFVYGSKTGVFTDYSQGNSRLYVIVEGETSSRIFSCPANDRSFCFMKKPGTIDMFNLVDSPSLSHSVSDSYSTIAASLVSAGYVDYAEAHHVESIGTTGWEIGQIHYESTTTALKISSPNLRAVIPMGYSALLHQFLGAEIVAFSPVCHPKWDVAGKIAIANNDVCSASGGPGINLFHYGESDYCFQIVINEYSVAALNVVTGYPDYLNTTATKTRKFISSVPVTGDPVFEKVFGTRPAFVRSLGAECTVMDFGDMTDFPLADLAFERSSFIGRITPSLKYRPQIDADKVYPSSGPAGVCCDCSSISLQGDASVIEGGQFVSKFRKIGISTPCFSSKQTGNVQAIDFYDDNGNQIADVDEPSKVLQSNKSSHAWVKVNGKAEIQDTVVLKTTNDASYREDYLLIESAESIDCNKPGSHLVVMKPLGGMDQHPIKWFMNVITQGSASQSESVKFSVFGPPVSGTYKIFLNGLWTNDIQFDAIDSDLQNALEGIVGAGNVAVSLVTPGPSICFLINFRGALSSTNIGPMTVDVSDLVPKKSSYTTQRASLSSQLQVVRSGGTSNGVAHNAIVKLVIPEPNSDGGFIVSFLGEDSDEISFSATASEIENKLESMAVIDDVVVSQIPGVGSQFLIEFVGLHAGSRIQDVTVNFPQMNFSPSGCDNNYRNCPGSLLEFTVSGLSYSPQVMLASESRPALSMAVPSSTGGVQGSHFSAPAIDGIYLEGSYEDCFLHMVVPEPDVAVDSGLHAGNQRRCELYGKRLYEAWWRTVNTGDVKDYAVVVPNAGVCFPGWTPPYHMLDCFVFCGLPASYYFGDRLYGDITSPERCFWVSAWPSDITASVGTHGQDVVTAYGNCSLGASGMTYVSPYDQWRSNGVLIPGAFGKGPARDCDYASSGPVTISASFYPSEDRVVVTVSYEIILQLRRPYDTKYRWKNIPSGFDSVTQNYQVGVIFCEKKLHFEATGVKVDDCLRPNIDRSRVVSCAFAGREEWRSIRKPFTITTDGPPPDYTGLPYNVVSVPFPDLNSYPVNDFIDVLPSAKISLRMVQRGVTPVGYPAKYKLTLPDNIGAFSGDRELILDSFENHWIEEVSEWPFVKSMLVPGWYLIFFESQDSKKSVVAKYRLSCKEGVRAQWNRYGMNEMELASCQSTFQWPKVVTILSDPISSP